MSKISMACGWADEEFGNVRPGDVRLRERLLMMAARLAETPGGTVTQVFDNSAVREGAYRFVENDVVEAEEIGRAARCGSSTGFTPRSTGKRPQVATIPFRSSARASSSPKDTCQPTIRVRATIRRVARSSIEAVLDSPARRTRHTRRAAY